MRTVTKVTSNLLSPNNQPWTFDLESKVLLEADNGAGKSMLSHAVRLGLSGETVDFNGKRVREGATLMEMAPFAGDGELYTHLTLSDGSNAAWGVVREGGKISRTDHLAPGINSAWFVLDAVKAALAGDETTGRKAFLSWVAADRTVADVKAVLPEHLHVRYDEVAAAKRTVGGLTEAEVLVEVATHAAGEARRIETSAKEADAQALALREALGVAARPDDATLAGAKTSAQAARDYYQQAAAWAAWQRAGAKTSADWQEERTALVAQQQHAQSAVAYWQAQVPVRVVEQAHPSLHAHQLAAELFGLTLHSTDHDANACFACGTRAGLEVLGQWEAYHRGKVSAAPTSTVADDQEASQARTNAEGWQREVDRLTREIGVIDRMIATAPDSAPPEVAHTPEEAQAVLDQWSAYVIRLETERARHDAVKPASDRAAAMRATIPQWQDLAKHCKEAIKVLLERGADTFTERVQHYLPAKWKFDLKLVDPENPEREVFRVALIQNDGRPSGYMSGSQRDAVMIACAMAVAERGGTAAETPKKKGRKSKAVASVASAAAAAEPLYLLIPEDRDRDEETLKELLKAWAKFPGQVIVEVTKRPGRVPAGWQHINLNAWRASLSEATPAPTEKENEETVQPSPAAVPPPVPAPAAAAQTFAALPPGAPAPAPVQAPAPPAPPQEAAVSTEPQGPRAATEEDIADLRTLSWSDSDIWNADAAAIKYIRLNRVKPDRANIRPDGKVRVVVAPPALPPTA